MTVRLILTLNINLDAAKLLQGHATQTAARHDDTAIRAIRLPADGSDPSSIQLNMAKTTDMMRVTLRLGTKEAGIESTYLIFGSSYATNGDEIKASSCTYGCFFCEIGRARGECEKRGV